MAASNLCRKISRQHSDCEAGIPERREWGEDDGKSIVGGDGWWVREALAGKFGSLIVPFV